MEHNLLSPLEGYARWASCYDEDGNPLIPLEGEATRRWYGSVAGQQVLDLGCGTGRHAVALADAGATVAALDQSPPMLERARAKIANRRIALVRGKLPGPLPFKDGSFALVVLGLVAEHVEDLATLINEVVRVLIPSGRCILSTLHPDRTAAGQMARYIDVETGHRLSIATLHRTKETYLVAARAERLELLGEDDLIVTVDLAHVYPRACNYTPHGWFSHY